MLSLPPFILSVLSHFFPLFYRPTYKKLLVLLTGHLVCRGRRTIANCLRCVGLANEKKYSSFYDLFRRARWSSFKASKILLLLIVREWISQTVTLVVDTSLERRRGPRIYGLGMHRDAVRSTKNKKVFSTGHNWLVVSVLIRFPGTKTSWSLPFISILLRNKKPLKSSRNNKDLNCANRHKKFTQYTSQLAFLLRRWLGPNREILILADSAFSCRKICHSCKKNGITFITILRGDASLFSPPPPPTGKRGRRRVVGHRLPNLDKIAEDPNTNWSSEVISWYGGGDRRMDLATGTALWYHNSAGKPIPIRWVLCRDPQNPEEIMILLCTNQNYSPIEIVESYVLRWSIETTFQQVRSQIGYESLNTWSDKGIERVSPAIMASYSIICLAAAKAMKERNEEIKPQKTIWYNKTYITFSDVFSYVRSSVIKENIFPHISQNDPLRKKIINKVLYWAMAA